MKGLERRQTSRKTVERFAYINIEPSNGGSVLNVSEGGLCFRAISLQLSEIRQFVCGFRDHDRRIEVQGDLVWMNERLEKTAADCVSPTAGGSSQNQCASG